MSHTLTTLTYDKFRMMFIPTLVPLARYFCDSVGYMRNHAFPWTVPLSKAWFTICNIQRIALDAPPLSVEAWIALLRPYLVTGLTDAISLYNDPENHHRQPPYNPGIWDWSYVDMNDEDIFLVSTDVARQLGTRFAFERESL